MNIQENEKVETTKIGSEFGLIGSILSDNNLINRLYFLESRHFSSQFHAEIFSQMMKLNNIGAAITPFNVLLGAEWEEEIKLIGGLARYLGSSIANSVAMMHPIEEARNIVALAQKREFIDLCSKMSAHAETSESTPEELIAIMTADLDGLLKARGVTKARDDHEVTQAIIDRLKDNRKPYATGFEKLDRAMAGGFYPGKSYGFAARKKCGKTILAGTISCNLAMAGIKHSFICGEMSDEEIHERTLARLTGSWGNVFHTDEARSDEFFNKIITATKQTKQKILYHNAPGLTFHELKRLLSVALSQGIKGFILDYWQLVGGKPRGQSTSEHLDEVAQWIADFCRRHGIWSMVMAQINQEGNTRGGEGLRLAFDQVYQINSPSDDVSRSGRWLEMMDTRYTAWANVGSESDLYLRLNEKAPFFEVRDVPILL